MPSANSFPCRWVLTLLLATPLRAGVSADYRPPAVGMMPPGLDDSGAALADFRSGLLSSRAETDLSFQRDRWPCILQGAAWSKRQETLPPPATAARLIPLLKQVFAAEGLPAQLAWLAEVESTMDPAAVSKSGAIGLFQFKREAARRFDLLHEQGDHRGDPMRSAQAAARYLAHLYRQLGEWPLALAGYNAGEGRVDRLLRKHGARHYHEIAAHLPPETQVYVIKVMTTLALRENVKLGALPAPGEPSEGPAGSRPRGPAPSAPAAEKTRVPSPAADRSAG